MSIKTGFNDRGNDAKFARKSRSKYQVKAQLTKILHRSDEFTLCEQLSRNYFHLV